ncbi:MAG: hypothetical protein RJA70_4810 [Pseudomonadota bacterium]
MRGAGGLLVGLPVLDAMRSSRYLSQAHAQNEALERRFVVFFTPNGVVRDAWLPYGSGNSFQFVNPAAPSELRILAPLEAFKAKLNVLDGIEAKSRGFGPGGNGHDLGMGHMLTANELLVGPSGKGEFGHLPDGSVSSPSIDQVLAEHLGKTTRFRSLEFGVISRLNPARQLTSRMSYRGAFEVVPPENDPREMFKSIFSGAGGSQEEVDRLHLRRQSVLDKVTTDLESLKPKLGAADSAKLDSHLTSIRELEEQLNKAPVLLCTPPDEPPQLDPFSRENFPSIGELQMKLLTTALACDATRVATLQWSTAQSRIRHTWVGATDTHHSLSHEADDSAAARDELNRIDHWYAQQFAKLLTLLDGQDDVTGTLLDNSVVMWVNEQGNGDLHSQLNIPYVLAGSGRGALPTGRFLQLNQASHADLYVSMMHAMGKTDTNTFGLAEVCKGPLAGLA